MKNIYKFYFFILIFTGCGFIAKAQPFDFSKPDAIDSNKIELNVKHYKYTYNSVPWSINVVEADIAYISLTSIKGRERLHNSREKLSSMAERSNENGLKVTAALNADFFYPDGDIVNNQISKGEFVKGISTKRSQFALTESGIPIIAAFAFTGKIITKQDSLIDINAINFRCGNDSVVILNRYWNREINPLDSVTMYSIKPVDSIKHNKHCRAIVIPSINKIEEISNNDYLLTARGLAAERLKRLLLINDTLSIFTGFCDQNENLIELAGGLPQIVKNGADISEIQTLAEGAGEKFRDTRHPRSAIGYNKEKNKLFLVTVDGRQKISVGMSLKELASFMLYLGCYDALNFDGGGSTTMIVNNKIVNSPSDLLGERSIGNSLLLLTE